MNDINDQDWVRIRGTIIDSVEASVKSTVPEQIKRSVNGKIDNLAAEVEELKRLKKDTLEMIRVHNQKHEDDMKETLEYIQKVKPLVEGISGAKILGETLKWLAGIAAAWLVIKSFINGEI